MRSQFRPARLAQRPDVICLTALAHLPDRLGGLRVWACGKAWHPGPLDEGGHPGQGGHGRPRGNSLFASETQAMRLHRGGVSSNARPWMIQLVHGLGPRSDLNQKCSNNAKKTGLHVWRCLTGWRSAASRVNGSLHTTETFFLWQGGPYITRQRVPLTVVYDRHPTTPCPNEESWPKHPSSTAIVRLLWTGLGPRTFLPSPDSLSLSRSLFLSFIGLPPY